MPILSTSIRTYICTSTAQLVDPESYSSLVEWLLTSGRGVVHGSITQLSNCVVELEGTPDQPHNADRAQQLFAKLQNLESDYKTIHLQSVDLINEEDDDALYAELARFRHTGWWRVWSRFETWSFDRSHTTWCTWYTSTWLQTTESYRWSYCWYRRTHWSHTVVLVLQWAIRLQGSCYPLRGASLWGYPWWRWPVHYSLHPWKTAINLLSQD